MENPEGNCNMAGRARGRSAAAVPPETTPAFRKTTALFPGSVLPFRGIFFLFRGMSF